MNITGAAAGNPRFHHVKTVLCLTDINSRFQITIVRSYRAAMIVLHVSSYVRTQISRGQETL